MKRLLQILVLLGMTVVWVLTPVTQTVQAEKSKDETHKTVFRSQIFTGPITLTARLFTDTPHWQAKIEWTATGTVFINFPKTNLNKKSQNRIQRISLNPPRIWFLR